MNIVPEVPQQKAISQFEIEQVQLQKQEFYLLGTFLRTKGLSLFYYNPVNGEVKEAKIKYSDTIHVYKLPDRWIHIDWESQKCTVDSCVIYFEVLNMRTAKERVKKYKEGKIKELSNLRVPNPEGIKFY
jgi:ribosomal protein S26